MRSAVFDNSRAYITFSTEFGMIMPCIPYPVEIGLVSSQRPKNGGLYFPVSFAHVISLADWPAEVYNNHILRYLLISSKLYS